MLVCCYAAGDKLSSKSGLDARATLSRATLSRFTRRAPASAGSKRSLLPASSVFQSTVRPGSAFATQRRPTALKFAASADLTDQVFNLLMFGSNLHSKLQVASTNLQAAEANAGINTHIQLHSEILACKAV